MLYQEVFDYVYWKSLSLEFLSSSVSSVFEFFLIWVPFFLLAIALHEKINQLRLSEFYTGQCHRNIQQNTSNMQGIWNNIRG